MRAWSLRGEEAPCHPCNLKSIREWLEVASASIMGLSPESDKRMEESITGDMVVERDHHHHTQQTSLKSRVLTDARLPTHLTWRYAC